MRVLDRIRTAVRRSGLLRATTAKVAVFAVVCLVVLGALVAKIGNISFFSHRVGYQAQLADATGLEPSDAVKIAGVTVGQVDGVSLQRGHALVTFSVDRSVHLPADTEVGEQWHNVLGQMYLYLYPGHSAKRLPAGGTIPLSRNVSGADVGALLNSLGPFLGALHPQQANQVVEAFAEALEGNENQVDQLITNAASVSQTVGSVDVQVGQVIDNLNQVLQALASRSGDLGQLIGNLQTVSQSLSDHNDLLDDTVANLGQVAGELATLEGNTHGTLSQEVSDLQAVSSEIESKSSELANGLSTLGEGLAPYVEISSYGQWFQVQNVYNCLADETSCTYYEGSNAPAGSGPGGSPPASGLPSPAASGSGPLSGLGGVPAPAAFPSGAAAEAGILKMVGGAP